MSHWNYRVVQSFDQTEYFIAEVYYDGDATLGWVDSGHDCLRWDDYDDLKGPPTSFAATDASSDRWG